MASKRRPLDDSEPEADEDGEGLSQNGQMIGISVFGGLLVVGFFFGVVTGYESPKPPVVVVKEVTKPEPPKPQPKVEPTPPPEPKKVEPTPPPPEPKKVEPTPPPEPKKVNPSPEPKGTTEPAAVAVSFEKNVKPILRTYCFNCHGAVGKPKGDVDLTTLAKILDPDNPPILKPGNLKGSAIFTTIDDGAMPPDPPRPGKGELDVIRNWILGGAKP
jgi:hypothetical protein